MREGRKKWNVGGNREERERKKDEKREEKDWELENQV